MRLSSRDTADNARDPASPPQMAAYVEPSSLIGVYDGRPGLGSELPYSTGAGILKAALLLNEFGDAGALCVVQQRRFVFINSIKRDANGPRSF